MPGGLRGSNWAMDIRQATNAPTGDAAQRASPRR
jgi:hypothetical protein